MKELERIIRTYFNKNTSTLVYYDLNQELFNKVIDSNNIGIYERPDILSMFDDKITAIEHFEFDSYNVSRKGSALKREEFLLDKKIDEKMKEKLPKLSMAEPIMIHDEIKNKASLENYYNNFNKSFTEHYKKIDEYIDHISEDFDCKDKEIHFCFFAEDVTPLGNYYLNKNGNINILLPIFSEEVIEVLNNSPKVEYLIIGTFCMSENKLIIIENKREVLERFKTENGKIKESDFFNFQPQTIGYAIRIPREVVEKQKGEINNDK